MGNAKLKRVFFLRLLLASALFIGGLGACDNFSCRGGEGESRAPRAEIDASWARESPLSKNIPATARSVFFSRDLTTALETFEFMGERLPLAGVSAFRGALEDTAGFDPFDSDNLVKIGVEATAPVALFYDRGYWVFAAEIADTKRVRAFFERVHTSEDAGQGAFAVKRVSDDAIRLVTQRDGAAQLGWVGMDDKRFIAAVRADKLSINEDDTGLAGAWLTGSKRPRFVADGENQKLLQELSPQGAVIGIVRPAAWMADIKAHGHANTLLKRLVSQVGPVGVAANAMSLQEGVRLRIIAPGNPRAPAMITSMGQADGLLVAPDGLVEPGVLAVARLSLDPRKLYELFVSLLPAEQRDGLASFWEELDRELSINAQRDVLENLRGHAVLVAYGLDPDALKPDPKATPWFLRALKLESTREAVLLPIKEREPLELVLDALTTVSKGKLSRQVAGLTTQYAWMDDGELKWAVILGDEYLIYVDSAVAFEHARAYERGVRPMAAELEEIGISRLFGPKESAGLYLDAATLGGILGEKSADASTSIAWLNALSSVIITTREEGAASPSVTDVFLRVAPPSRAPDRPAVSETPAEPEVVDTEAGAP